MDQQDYEHEYDVPPYATRRHQSRGFDPEMRRIALIAGGFAVAVVVVALVWGGVHPRLGPPPVIKPPPGPMHSVPANPGGLQVPGANEQIMSGKVASGPPQLAPPPPAPDFSALAQQGNAARPKPAPASPAPAPSDATTQAAALPKPPPLPAPPPASPATASAAASPSSQVGKALPAITTPRQATSSGAFAIQLAALTSMPKANEAWQTLLARVPDLLAGRKPVVVPGQVKGRTYYRLRLGGFTSAAAADDFCARLKSRHVSCYVPPQ